MRRLLIPLVIVSLLASTAVASLYSWNPKRRVPITLRDALNKAEELLGDDAKPERHQVVEIPRVTPDVTDYLLHCWVCPDCGKATRAELRKVFRTMVQRARDYYASKGITEVPPEVSDGTDEGSTSDAGPER